MRFTLDLAGFTESVLMEAAELEQLHLPIVKRFESLAHGRLIVFVAGVPGAGKSLLAALWAELAGPEGLSCPFIVLPMDGFHLTNRILRGRTVIRDGTELPLELLKGAPETFDVDALADRLEEVAGGGPCWWPAYDRRVHEPVREGMFLPAGRGVLLVEGNYLLLDQDGWRDLTRFAHTRFFVDATFEAVEAGLIRRHRRGGKTTRAARVHVRRTDLPNVRLVRARRLPADVVLCRRAVIGKAIGFRIEEAADPWSMVLAR